MVNWNILFFELQKNKMYYFCPVDKIKNKAVIPKYIDDDK